MAVDTGQALPSWNHGAIARRVVSVDHKQIGAFYLLTALFFLLALGIASLLLALETAHTPGGLLSQYAFEQLFSMQGSIVLFAFGLPAALGLASYLVPLMIGARQSALPQLNALAFWLYLCGTALMLVSFAAGNPSDASPAVPLSPQGQQLWLVGLLLASLAATVAAVVLLATVWTRAAEGMTQARMPVFVRANVLFALVLLVSMPILAAAAATYLVDDGAARSFFVFDVWGKAAFYQTPVWFFGNPVTYALLLPLVGIVSEIVPVLSRRALASRELVLLALVMTAVLAVLVGIYRLVADGLGDGFRNYLPLAGFVALVPLALAEIAWISTLRGSRRGSSPQLVAVVGTMELLVLGAILGLALGFPGAYHGGGASYHLTAHFTGTLGGAGLLALVAAIAYWFPKLTGRLLDEKLVGRPVIFLVLGLNLLVIGQHIAGEGSLSRGEAISGWSSAAKIGALIALAGFLLVFLGGAGFIAAIAKSSRAGRRVGNDPWLADTLEWYAASPPPPGNFDRLPPITSERPLYDLRVRLGRESSD